MRDPVCRYVYSPAVLTARIAALRAVLPDGAGLYYAVKANSHPALLEAAAAHADGLEVASGGELAKAVAAGARRVVFGGPGKTDAELAAAASCPVPVIVNVESAWELRRLSYLAQRPVDVCVRVARASGLTGSHQMTGVPAPFGVPEEELGDVLALAGRLPRIRLRGLHLHAVSSNLDAAAHAAFVTGSLAWAGTVLPDAEIVNCGGGLGVDYTGGTEFSLTGFGAGLPADPRLVVEPGRWLVAPAGRYEAEVLDLKKNGGVWFAVLRGGTHHFRLPAAWGYSHPFTVRRQDAWPYPMARPVVRDAAVTAAGELCTPRDVLCRDQHVDELRVGDVLVFALAGAYGLEVSHHDFLSHPKPGIAVEHFA
ncbi:alanine racemase [Longispora albida]|uniref:alanine racemase n=1 Tax=Longispora albida TaxID=203523 RepID=UPI00036D376F|nr:alanine racemase [Longispora albida]